MRPINGVSAGNLLLDPANAKPHLVSVMGAYCVYCERHIPLMNLHVEHIKPQSSHIKLRVNWRNFLLACSSCNGYKSRYQKTMRQTGILVKQAWPHLDNTFLAYTYNPIGMICVSATLTATQKAMAGRTMEMVGLDKIPDKAMQYEEFDEAYGVIKERAQTWTVAQTYLRGYQRCRTAEQREKILITAVKYGFFSIWMAVFAEYPKLKNELIKVFKAAPECFDAQGAPINPRQPGRI